LVRNNRFSNMNFAIWSGSYANNGVGIPTNLKLEGNTLVNVPTPVWLKSESTSYPGAKNIMLNGTIIPATRDDARLPPPPRPRMSATFDSLGRVILNWVQENPWW
jgi:hypothetical protein